jgi:iron complex outermembrane receptor protein
MKTYLLAIGCLFGTTVNAQYNLTGKVVNQETKTVLAGANIVTADGTRAAATDEYGQFVLTGLKKGETNLIVSYVGFGTRELVVDIPFGKTLVIELNVMSYLTDEILITATRASGKMPLTFTQMEKEDIEAVNMGKDIPYLLESMPSVVTTSDAGTGVGYTGMRIRGSDATRINVTLNGIPYNDSESQGVYWVDLPDMASSVESIQVQRGVGTSTNGPGAFGASINIQTTGLNEQPYAVLANSYGSFNTWKNTLTVGTGLINNAFTIDGRISRITSDGYIDRATADLSSFYLSGGYYGNKNVLKLNIFSGHEITYQAWYGTPESRINNDVQGMNDYIARNGLTTAEADNLLNSGRTYNFYTYDNQVDDYKQTHYQLIYGTSLSEKIGWNTAFHFTHGEGFFEQYKEGQDLNDYGFSGGTTDLIRRRWLSNNFFGLTFSLDYDPSSQLNLLVGGAWNKYDGDHFGEIIWAQNAGNSAIRDRYYDNNGIKYDFTVYGKLSLDLTTKISLFSDLQYRKVNYTLFGLDSDRVQLDERHEFNFFNPKFGLNYQLNEQASLYGSFSVGNKEPSRSDFVDSPDSATPKAEKLNNVEIGYKHQTKQFTFNVNYYLMDYRNQLVLTGELNDVGAPLRTNVAKSYRTGIELLAGMELSPKFKLDFNATFSNNIIKDYTDVLYDYGQNWDEYNALITSFEQTTISFSPGIIAGGSIKYSPFNGLSISWNHKYVGDQYLDNTANENRKLAAYYYSDFFTTYTFSALKMKEIGFKLAIYNLFNNLYESNGYTFGYRGGGQEIRENFYYPQAGINFMAGLTLKL